MSAVRITHLTFEYPHHRSVLKDVNAHFDSGKLTLITGPSGSGKSTLLKLMARLTPIKHGMVYYGDQLLPQIPAKELSNYVGMMFQEPNRQFAMRTVKEEIIFTLENRRTVTNQIQARVERILKDNHLTNFKNRKLMKLSGGEKQRVALAIITALDSKVILLDEPFTNVDISSRHRIMQKLVALKRAGKTIVIVDHDLRGYQAVTDQLLVLKDQTLKPAKFSEFAEQLKEPDHHWQMPGHDRPIYQLEHFSAGYQKPLINVNNFVFDAHHATLITGPNGSGKSTLFKSLLKLIKYQGKVNFNGHNVQKLKTRKYYRNVNLIFQEATDQFLEITVKQELQLTIENAFHHYYSRSDLQKWLRFTGLDQHLHQVVYSLSGGQQRSLQIIEGLVNGAPVLLMDEPFQSLDHRLVSFFKALLHQAVNHDRRTLIVISHQIAPVSDLFDYHVQLASRQLSYQRGLTSL